MTTCTMPNCEKPHRAKGLCVTHYNQRDPNRHRPIQTECAQCGTPIVRSSRATRWANNYCSELCSHWHRFGTPWKSELPADHWARMYGASCAWTAPAISETRECAWCGKGYATTRSLQRFCCMNHKRKAKMVRRRGREHDAPGEYSWAQLSRLWLTFDKACAYCSQPTSLADTQAEHVHPLSRGGRNDLGNLLPSCGPCNSDKRDLLLHEWSEDRARRQLPPVKTTWTDNDTRYSHLVNIRSTGTTRAA